MDTDLAIEGAVLGCLADPGKETSPRYIDASLSGFTRNNKGGDYNANSQDHGCGGRN